MSSWQNVCWPSWGTWLGGGNHIYHIGIISHNYHHIRTCCLWSSPCSLLISSPRLTCNPLHLRIMFICLFCIFCLFVFLYFCLFVFLYLYLIFLVVFQKSNNFHAISVSHTFLNIFLIYIYPTCFLQDTLGCGFPYIPASPPPPLSPSLTPPTQYGATQNGGANYSSFPACFVPRMNHFSDAIASHNGHTHVISTAKWCTYNSPTQRSQHNPTQSNPSDL